MVRSPFQRTRTLRIVTLAGTALVALLIPQAEAAVQASSSATSASVASQSLGFAHDPNLRDIGGVRTEDGRRIKEGLLFRGGAMDKLSDAEVAKLAALGITKSIDLRTPDEVAQAPDRLPAGVPTINDSILANDDPSVTWSIGGLDTAEVFRLMGYAHGQYMFIYDELGGGPGETYGFRQFFDEVLASDGAPLLYHCTAGDDRTGWATYVLMRVLGASPQAAMRNYLASNTYNVDMLQGYTDYFESIGFTHEQSDFFLKADYIKAAEHTAVSTFGSWNNYLRLGLGLTSADVAKLKSLYLSK